MIQLIELSAIVGFCYEGVKVLLSPGDRGRRSDSREGYIFFIIDFKNTIINSTRPNTT